MIRSRVANILLLLFGISLLVFALVIVGGYLLATTPRPFPIGPLAFFGALGCWCTAGAVINLRAKVPASQAAPPLKTAVLVKANIALILSSLAGTILFMAFGQGGPDPGILQRSVGMVMAVSVLAVPIVLGAHLVERFLKSRGRAQQPGGQR